MKKRKMSFRVKTKNKKEEICVFELFEGIVLGEK